MATENADGHADMLEKKHAERLERLALINKNRLEGSSTRKSQAADSSDPRESVDVFLSAFGQKRELVEQGLASALKMEIDPTHIREHLDNLALEASAMDKLLADASYFLPAYDVRASQTTILKLKEDLEAASSKLLPKKKFSFRNKAAKKPPTQEKSISGQTGVENQNGSHGTESYHSVTRADVSQQRLPLPAEQEAPLAVCEDNSRERIQGKENMVFVRDADVLGAELTLSNLNNCRVYLRGRLTTLYIHTLRNCRIFVGPVTGSVFIENVEDSTLVLASHQIRIHSTKDTDFYLRVRSRPIVEFTTKNRFAPYAFSYSGIEEDLAAANLAEETGLWEKVDDFRWLRAVPSPNWTSLPMKERIPLEDGSIVKGVGCDE